MIKPRHLLAAFACLLLAACGQSALVEEQPDTDTATLLITALDRYGIDALQQAADSGEAEAMRLLGNCRFLGLEACGGFDREEGGRLLLAASQAGSVRAQTDMCRTWMDRLPEPEDQAEAIGLCRAALDAGDNEARALLPLYALRGVTAACEVFPDGEAALREALAQGNPHAAHYLALAWSEQLLTPRTGESALALARAAAPDGGLTAAIDLADAEALAAQDGAELLAVADRLAASPALAIPAVRARIGFWHLLADDEAGGFEQLEQAAASGAPEALLILASGLQLQNRSTSASGQSLRQLLGLAADNGLVSALEQVATIEHDSGNLELAAQLAERAARSGQPHTFNLRDQYSADWRQQQAQAELAQRVIEALQAQPDSRSQSGQPAYTPPPRPRRTARPMANTCDTTGLGPGNDAACGAQATICTTTGLGPGNAAACGGRATICTTTGLGPGNDAACGGLATICTTTGLGPGNDAACGGLATICTTTGLGPGNDAACGGQATICTSTGLGEGNVEACGGRAR